MFTLSIFLLHMSSILDSHLFLDGNKVSGPNFNLCFGGRRLFCKTDYADLGRCSFYHMLYFSVSSVVKVLYHLAIV